MRKIIHNRAYDTKTSRVVGVSVALAEDGSEGHHIGLYRKRTGEYFLCSEPIDANESARGTITPVSYDEALRWATDHLTSDECEREFGKAPDDGGETVLSVRVSSRASHVLEQWCSRTGDAKGATVDHLIIEYLS